MAASSSTSRSSPRPRRAQTPSASTRGPPMAEHAVSDPLAGARAGGGLLIAAGAISIVAGLLVIAYPDITLLAFAIFAGVNLLILSALSLADSFDGSADSGARALSAVLGVLGIIAGLVVLKRP